MKGMDAKTKKGSNHLGSCIMKVRDIFVRAGLCKDINMPYPKYVG